MAIDSTNEILDIWQLFVNEIIGDPILAIILFLIISVFASIKANLPFELTLMFGILTLAAMFSQSLIMTLWVFILLLVGLMFYLAVAKLMEGQ